MFLTFCRGILSLFNFFLIKKIKLYQLKSNLIYIYCGWKNRIFMLKVDKLYVNYQLSYVHFGILVKIE